MNRRIRVAIGKIVAMAVTSHIVAACGGGGSNFVGIDRLGVSSGTITGFGSVFVNGVEWDTSGASISVDDNAGIESELRIGQVVTVRGTLNADGTQGDADSIDFDNSVEGPITSINLAAESVVVLGQTVIVSADTEFDDSIPAGADGQRTLQDLAVNDVVEVSGYRDSAGAVRATRIELGGGGGEFEVKGFVSDLNATTFQIGALVVNYAGARLDDFGSDTLSNGDFVEAKGDSFAGDVFVADTVEREDPPSAGESGDESEVEGYITRFVSATDFDVAGITVTTDAGTEFEGGTSADLALNVKVEVEGEVNSSGVIVADKVEIRIQPEDADAEITGDVATVNVAAGTLTIEGMDVVISVDAVTRFEDDSSAGLTSFSLADVTVGDHVEVRGAEDLGTAAVNDTIATSLKRKNADDEVELRGPVQAINEPDLSILGVQVTTDFAVFRDENENTIDAATFFAMIAVDDVVEASATSDQVAGNLFTADEVEIEELD